MIKVTKIGNDGKEHQYWEYTEEEIAERQKLIDEIRAKQNNNNQEQ